jgi:2,4-dienoyl-CoA reductase-like NADH-dependent reductase (Old Yellow Enzyme family)
VLRRFGQTGLTVAEIGFTSTGAGADPALVEAALRLGMRFLCLPATVAPEALAKAGGDTLLATVDHGGQWAPPDSPNDRQWDLLVARTTLNSLVDRDFLDRARAAIDEGRFGGLAARVYDEAGARRVIETGAFDAIELAFGLRQQNLLLGCLPLLRDWGGAVIVRLVPSSGGAEVDRWLAAEDDVRTPNQLAAQAALLSEVVSVVVQQPRDEADLRDLVACSRDLPALTVADTAALDRALTEDGVRSGLSELHRRRRTPVATRGLDDSWRLGPLRLRNRIVRSGSTERAVDGECLPTDAMVSLHRSLAAGGAGMIITGYLAVSRDTRASRSHGVLQPGPAVDAWANLLTVCRREADVPFCAQLGHGGALSTGSYDERDVVRRFAEAARAAEAAGFDAVQLHGAHGYLLGQLLAEAPPLRAKGATSRHHGLDLVRRVIHAVRAEVGDRLAVLMKLNCSDFVSAGYDQRDSLVAFRALAETGLDGVEWSGWVPAAPAARTPSRLGEVEVRSEGFFVPFAARTKAENPRLAVGTCGGFRSAAGMTRAVADYGLDFVSLARPLVAEPDLPRKLLDGQARARCDGCNECLAKHVRPLHCPRALVLTPIGEAGS